MPSEPEPIQFDDDLPGETSNLPGFALPAERYIFASADRGTEASDTDVEKARALIASAGNFPEYEGKQTVVKPGEDGYDHYLQGVSVMVAVFGANRDYESTIAAFPEEQRLFYLTVLCRRDDFVHAMTNFYWSTTLFTKEEEFSGFMPPAETWGYADWAEFSQDLAIFRELSEDPTYSELMNSAIAQVFANDETAQRNASMEIPGLVYGLLLFNRRFPTVVSPGQESRGAVLARLALTPELLDLSFPDLSAMLRHYKSTNGDLWEDLPANLTQLLLAPGVAIPDKQEQWRLFCARIIVEIFKNFSRFNNAQLNIRL